jgi:Cys-tRNA(Pro)/Cys-tRNA(Cys) deacylase
VPRKTNAVRLLEQSAIQYELKEYELDPEELSAEVVAARSA